MDELVQRKLIERHLEEEHQHVDRDDDHRHQGRAVAGMRVAEGNHLEVRRREPRAVAH